MTLPLIAVCALGWGLQPFAKKSTWTVRTSTKPPALRRVGAAAGLRLFFRGRPFLLGQPAEHDLQRLLKCRKPIYVL